MQAMRGVLLGVFLCAMTCSFSYAQDIGTIKELEPNNDSIIPTDPYKGAFKIRPLSYLLWPVTLGYLGSFNARYDLVWSRTVTSSVEANYFYQRPLPNDISYITLVSIRLDANYFFLKKENPDRYAEGFHAGPYLKYQYRDDFNPARTNAAYIRAHTTFIGAIGGFQYVKKKFVIDQSIGFGAGLVLSNLGVGIFPDARMGLSIGYAF